MTIVAKRFRLGSATLLLMIPAVAIADQPLAGSPPSGRTYFASVLGLATDSDGAYELDVACIRFTDDQICAPGAECGDWEVTEWGEPGAKQGEGTFRIEFLDDETGIPIVIDGVARIDARGRRSTIAAAAHARDSLGRPLNFGIVGRQVPPAKCQRLVEAFLSR